MAGSRISSPMAQASSMPMKALHMTAKLAAISQPAEASRGGCWRVPFHQPRAAAAKTRTTLSAALSPPMFCTHLPTPRPRMFKAAMKASHPKATEPTKSLESTSPAESGPPA